MSLLILLLIGANIGWLASIVMRNDRARDVLGNVALGVVGALVCGALASSVSLIEGITPATLIAAALGALALLTTVNLLRGADGPPGSRPRRAPRLRPDPEARP